MGSPRERRERDRDEMIFEVLNSSNECWSPSLLAHGTPRRTKYRKRRKNRIDWQALKQQTELGLRGKLMQGTQSKHRNTRERRCNSEYSKEVDSLI